MLHPLSAASDTVGEPTHPPMSVTSTRETASLPVERFTVLDSWRGIAALMVAVFHFNALHHGYFVPFVRNSYLFVDFFFVLSGFVIAHAYADRLATKRDVAVFAVRRFGRVWPLHAAVLAGFACQEGIKALLAIVAVKPNIPVFDPQGQLPLSHLFANLTLTHALNVLPGLTWNLPSWSISAEFWTYLIFALVTLTARRFSPWVMAGLALVSAATLMSKSAHGMDASYDLGLLRCIYGFGTGVLVYEIRPWLAAVASEWMGRLEWLALALAAGFVSYAGTGPLSFAAPLAFAVVVAVFSFEAGPVSRGLRGPILHALGQWSYSIYMVHVLIVTTLMLVIAVAQKPLGLELFVLLPTGSRVLGQTSPYVLDGLLAAYLLVVLGLARLTYRYIEDPGRALFNRWSGGLARV